MNVFFVRHHVAMASTNLVEVVNEDLHEMTYRDRRETWGVQFHLAMEQLELSKYKSPIHTTREYSDIFGSTPLLGVKIGAGVKLNTAIGSLIVGPEYSRAQVYDGTDSESLNITKTGAFARIQLDNLFSEPYVVPFVKASYMNSDIVASDATNSTVVSTGHLDELSAGVMLQLNWLEEDTSRNARASEGLENSYLEIYWLGVSHSPEESVSDQELSVINSYGVGLVLEF